MRHIVTKLQSARSVGEPMTARRRCILRCSVLGRGSCGPPSASLAGVVAEDEPAAALAVGMNLAALGRGRELPEHLGVEALVPCSELRIAEAHLELPPVAALRIRFHAVESTEGTSALRIVPFDAF